VAKELGTDVVVVKAADSRRRRGKGGGVKLARSADEAREIRAPDAGHEVGHASEPVRKAGKCACSSSRKACPSIAILSRHRSGSRVGSHSIYGVSPRMDIEEVPQPGPGKDHERDDRSGGGLRSFPARKLAFGLEFLRR